MTRILHLIPGLTGGGAERQLTLLARIQAERGHDVHIGMIRAERPAALQAPTPVHIHLLALRGHHDPLLFVRIHALMRAIRADVVQTWLTLMDIMGGGAALLLRRPWILSERSEVAAYPPTLKNEARARLGRRAHAIVANSSGGVRYWSALGVAASRVLEVPNAVDLDALADAPAGALPAVFADRPLVLFVGRLSEEKNALVLIDALARALPAVDATALLCGTGPLRDELAAAIQAHGQDERIVLAGHRSDVGGLLRKAQLCVAISRFEGSPNVVLEAMASGCPLVVSNIPAYRELLDAASALFVPVNDAAATAHAIIEALSNRPAAIARAEEARRRVAGFTPERVASAMDAVYRRLVPPSQ